MSDATDNMQSLTSLTVLNATAALERGLAAIRAGQREFDLRHVLTVDSVAVSVMLSWQRAAKEAGVDLELKNLPPALQSLTKLYGVCSLVFPSSVQLEPTPALGAHPAHAEFAPVADPGQASRAARAGLANGAAAAADPHHH